MSSQKNACFLEVSEIPCRNGPLGPEIESQLSDVLIHLSARQAKKRLATATLGYCKWIGTLENARICTNISIGGKKIVSTSVKVAEVQNAGTTGEKKEIKQWKESEWTLPLPNWNKWCVSFS